MKVLLKPALATLMITCANAALAQVAPPPLEAYGELPHIEDMAVSPNGKSLAMVGRSGEDRKLTVFEGVKLRASTAIGRVKLRSIGWAGDDLVTAVGSTTQRLGPGFAADKYEIYATYLVPLNGGKPDMVFARSSGMASGTFGNYGTRLVGGKWTGFYGGIEYTGTTGSRTGQQFGDGRPALFAVDLAANSSRKVGFAASEGHWRSWRVDGDGKPSAMLDINTQNGRWDIKNGEGVTLASGVDKSGNVDLIAFGAAGTSLIYGANDSGTQERRWFEVPLAGGSPVEYLPGVNIDRIYVDNANGRITGYLPNALAPLPVMFDSARQATLRKVFRAFPKLSVTIADTTPSLSHILVHTSGNGDSGTWYLVDMARMAADIAGNDRPQIAAAQVGPISTVAYKAADGTDLDGVLTLPPGRAAKNLPVVILPHGGPHAHDTASFDWWAQAFASRGYAVFQPNFRGSTNRDIAFMRAGYGQWGRKMQTDLSDGLAELVKQGIADPKRACIMGASYGGYAALAGVTLQQGLYRCAVAVAPVSDLKDMYWTQSRESGDSAMVRAQLRESLGDVAGFDAVSPRRSAAMADAPVLLIHGKDDTVVGFDQSTAMQSALKSAGKPVELVILKEEDHWLSKSDTRKQMLEAAMAFVQKHNPAD